MEDEPVRLATYSHHGRTRCGLVTPDGEAVRPLPEGIELLDLIRDDALGDAARLAGDAVPLAAASLLAPFRPPTVRDFVAFEEHVEGVRKSVDGRAGVPDAWYEAPAFYFTNPYAVIGPYDDVPVPPGCAAFDSRCLDRGHVYPETRVVAEIRRCRCSGRGSGRRRCGASASSA
jgi:2-keto-4-pentenoate hydratase/2-oxohepta-3-ene-1,7-dioic acid hydratase in catechol pathway